MNQNQRWFVGIMLVALLVEAVLDHFTRNIHARIPLSPFLFVVLAVLAAVFSRRGLAVNWQVLVGFAGAIVESILGFASTVIGSPTANSPLAAGWTPFSILGALVTVTLPIGIGALLGTLSSRKAAGAGTHVHRGLLTAIGLVPILHLFVFISDHGNRLEFPSLAILVFTIPIGVAMAIVGLVLLAIKHRLGPTVIFSVLLYSGAATAVIYAMNLLGVRFVVPS